jgi:hypothetical protein
LFNQDNEDLYDLDPEGIAIIQSYAPPVPMLVPLIMLNPLNCTYCSAGRIPPIFLATFVALLIASYMFTLLATHEMVKLEVQKMRRRSFVPGANLRFLPFGFHIPIAVPNIAPWQPVNVIQAFVEHFDACMVNEAGLNRNIVQPGNVGQVGVQARQERPNDSHQGGNSNRSVPQQPPSDNLIPSAGLSSAVIGSASSQNNGTQIVAGGNAPILPIIKLGFGSLGLPLEHSVLKPSKESENKQPKDKVAPEIEK